MRQLVRPAAVLSTTLCTSATSFDRGEEVLAHDSHGRVNQGSVRALADACNRGSEVKVAIGGLCSDLGGDPQQAMQHETLVHMGACYFYTDRQLLMAAAHPVVRTQPAIPLSYGTGNWDFGWLMPRSDGHLARWLHRFWGDVLILLGQFDLAGFDLRQFCPESGQ